MHIEFFDSEHEDGDVQTGEIDEKLIKKCTYLSDMRRIRAVRRREAVKKGDNKERFQYDAVDVADENEVEFGTEERS